MKINKLTISELRGIRSLTLNPNGKTLLIYGQNGTGKSGIVDAIDFLFTGNIKRISGEGAQGLSIARHGKHIACTNTEHCFVEAEVIFNDKNISLLKRSLNSPNDIYCPSSTPNIELALATAQKGKFCLTRKDILAFINAKSGTRAHEVEELLDLEDIANIRKILKTTSSSAKSNFKNQKTNLEDAYARLDSEFTTAKLNNNEQLKEVNNIRKKFSGQPLATLGDVNLQDGLQKPDSDPNKTGVNRSSLEQHIDDLKFCLKENNFQLVTANLDSLWAKLESLFRKPEYKLGNEKVKLTKLGLKILDEQKEVCPLCETPWDHKELVDLLTTRINSTNALTEQLEEIKNITKDIIRYITHYKNHLEFLLQASQRFNIPNEEAFMLSWKSSLELALNWLRDLLELETNNEYSKKEIKILILPKGWENICDTIYQTMLQQLPEVSKTIQEWDFLTRLNGLIKEGNRTYNQYEQAKIKSDRAEALYKTFIKSRDNILNNLYNSVADRFTTFYKELHPNDERNFRAQFKTKTAGLDLLVDFHGKGLHLPHAMHSDGHQDSMGLCLYLALAEKLYGQEIPIIILDDVVASIDSGHRRKITDLINKHFPKTQFIITTHEKVWSEQLAHGLRIPRENHVKFYNWNVDVGPKRMILSDFFSIAHEETTKDEIAKAAFTLRHGLEEFFAYTCEALQAKIPFKREKNWSLGELMDSSNTTYLKRLKSASKYLKKLNEDSSELNTIIKNFEEATKEVGKERWAVNPLVHFNEWANLSMNDFIPVLAAYEKLHELYCCDKCKSILTYDQHTKIISCQCNHCTYKLS